MASLGVPSYRNRHGIRDSACIFRQEDLLYCQAHTPTMHLVEFSPVYTVKESLGNCF